MGSRGRPGRDGVEDLRLDEVVDAQRLGCEAAGSPLYATVLDAVVDDVVTDGPSRRLLSLCEGATFGDAIVLRYLAGVHELVLAGRAPELARHYPSVGGTPGPGLAATFLDTVAAHEDELGAAMGRPVQTNEPGRSVALLVGYLEAARPGLPLRVLEVGASAGLNLWFDRYRYDGTDLAVGPSHSALQFIDPYVGAPLAALGTPEVATRRGCDLAPIDPSTSSGRRRLRSHVWPDHADRRRRLEAAITVVRDLPALVDRADAVAWTERALAEPVPGVTTVVSHSIVLQYLPLPQRRRFVEVVEEAGGRATAEAPLAWLRTEPAGDRAETRITTWPGEQTSVLALSGFHGPPVTVLPR
ncbi:MAG: DUF2332 domain-containing protein [Actinobacteria bacterium]|nr:DUF2332 domain-containing protein [Actinomycetota bacterium]